MTRRGAYQATSSMTTPSQIGERIKTIRRAWGWTQGELAIILHVPQPAVSAWEANRSKPIGPVLAHLLEVFGITKEALLEGKGFTIPDPEVALSTRNLVVAESESMRPVALPRASAGEVWRVEPEGDEPVLLSIKDATRYLQQVVQDGGAAWIVVRRPLKPRNQTKLA